MFQYFTIIFGIIALIAVGFWAYYYFSLRIPNGVTTDGEVTEIVPITRGAHPLLALMGKRKPQMMYHPVVRFKLDKEKAVKFRNREGFHAGTYKVGDKVKVLYDKENPLSAKIDG